MESPTIHVRVSPAPGGAPYRPPTGVERGLRRTLTRERLAQGFVSQEHLDAFLAGVDHRAECATCQSYGTAYDAPDGPQPTMQECDTMRALNYKTWQLGDQRRTHCTPHDPEGVCSGCE